MFTNEIKTKAAQVIQNIVWEMINNGGNWAIGGYDGAEITIYGADLAIKRGDEQITLRIALEEVGKCNTTVIK